MAKDKVDGRKPKVNKYAKQAAAATKNGKSKRTGPTAGARRKAAWQKQIGR